MSKELDQEVRQTEKGIKSLDKRIKEHEKKLSDYKANPDKFDHKGFLKDPQLRQQIIEAREKKLRKEIQVFHKQKNEKIQKLEKLHSQQVSKSKLEKAKEAAAVKPPTQSMQQISRNAAMAGDYSKSKLEKAKEAAKNTQAPKPPTQSPKRTR
jgi:hypothetical protein